MGIWELEAAIAVLLFALAVPVLLLPAVNYLYGRYGRLAGLPLLTLCLGALYGFALIAFTLFPIPADSGEACAATGAGWRLAPFASFQEALADAGDLGIVSFLTSAAFLQEAMNVLLLVPLGVLIGWRSIRPVWVAAVAGLGVSLAIELTQGTGVWSIYECPYRLAEFDDLLTNTAGAVLGWLLGRWARPRVKWPEPVRGSDQAATEPTVGRRVVAVLADFTAIVLIGVALQVAAAGTVTWLDGGAAPDEWPGLATAVLGGLLPVAAVAVAVPRMRSDRASPGQIATRLALVSSTGDAPVAISRLVTRGLVRWGPFMLASLWGPFVFVAAAVVQLAVVLRLDDHPSLAALASSTHTVVGAERRAWPGASGTLAG